MLKFVVIVCFCLLFVRMFAIFVSKTTAMGFTLMKYARKEDGGAYVLSGVSELESGDFGFCRYKSITGLNSRGRQKAVYSEEYADASSVRVYVHPTERLASTESVLTVYFFGSDPSLPTERPSNELMALAEKSWDGFCRWLSGGLVVWYDDVRMRRALFYLSSACEPSADVVKGVPYLCCQVTLCNVFGRSFDSEDTTIRDWLASGGRESVG